MKNSIIFQYGMKITLPLLLIISLIVFWRGHQLPGGGFIGGLVAGAALAAHAFSFGVSRTLSLIRFHPLTFVVLGLTCALISGITSLVVGATPFKALWISVPFIGELGTPILFDFGVYLLVVGFVLVFISETLKEEA